MSESKSISHRISTKQADFLIFFPLILLISVGVLNNNFSSSGISGNPTLTCDQTLFFCFNSGSTGCQSNPSSCSFASQTFSFLSQASPFTQLLSGNVFAVFNQITTGSASIGHGPFDSVGSNNYVLANCVVDTHASTSLKAFSFDSCTQANPDGSNSTKANANTWNNWNTNWVSSTKAIPFFNVVTNATVSLTCNWNFQINYTFSGSPYDGWTWYGCSYGSASGGFPASEKSQISWSFLVAVPWVQGALNNANGVSCALGGAGKCFHIRYAVQLEPTWETAECFFTAPISGNGVGRQTTPWDISPNCDQFSANLVSQGKTGGGNSGFQAFAPFITFLVGIALFLLGTGLGIQGGGSVLASGATFSVFSNPQGTKMAQVLGGGLVVWSIFLSEFGTWLVSTYLPFGLDTIATFLLSGCFFFGLYERM